MNTKSDESNTELQVVKYKTRRYTALEEFTEVSESVFIQNKNNIESANFDLFRNVLDPASKQIDYAALEKSSNSALFAEYISAVYLSAQFIQETYKNLILSYIKGERESFHARKSQNEGDTLLWPAVLEKTKSAISRALNKHISSQSPLKQKINRMLSIILRDCKETIYKKVIENKWYTEALRFHFRDL